MYITVEPRDGSELERLITALLNVTGIIRRIVEDFAARDDLEGVAIVDEAAARIHESVAVVGEHYDDDELALVTCAVLQMALLLASDTGLSHCFDDLR
jgi:hypothetical protein